MQPSLNTLYTHYEANMNLHIYRIAFNYLLEWTHQGMVSYEIDVFEMSTKRNTMKTQTQLEQDGISLCRVICPSKRNFYHMYFENIF